MFIKSFINRGVDFFAPLCVLVCPKVGAQILGLILACLLSRSVCLTLCDPMDYSPPGSSAHGILQAGTLEGVAVASFRAYFLPRD